MDIWAASTAMQGLPLVASAFHLQFCFSFEKEKKKEQSAAATNEDNIHNPYAQKGDFITNHHNMVLVFKGSWY